MIGLRVDNLLTYHFGTYDDLQLGLLNWEVKDVRIDVGKTI